MSSRADTPEISFTVDTGSSIQTRRAGALVVIWYLTNQKKEKDNLVM